MRDTRTRPLEVVLETVNPTEVAIIKSLLEGAGIPYLTRGEDQYDAFRGAFRGTVFMTVSTPAGPRRAATYFPVLRCMLHRTSGRNLTFHQLLKQSDEILSRDR